MNKYYTMIGSRSTPKSVLELMENIAHDLKQQGYIGRSGGANGADQALEDGCLTGTLEGCHIYLPWNGFNGKYASERGYIDTPKMKNYEKAQRVASEYHPAWGNCKRGARAMHTRNVYQVLGHDLATPSEFVICYAEPQGTKGHVKGGTGQAVRIAIDNNIPVINLWHDCNKDVENVLQLII